MARARRRTAWRTIPPTELQTIWRAADTMHKAKRGLSTSRQLADVPEFSGFIAEHLFAQEIEQARPSNAVYAVGGDCGYDFVWGGQHVDVKAGRFVRGREPDLLLFTDGMVRCDCYALVAVELPDCSGKHVRARVNAGCYPVRARLTMVCRALWAHDRKPVVLSTGCRIRVTPWAAQCAHKHNAFVYQEAVPIFKDAVCSSSMTRGRPAAR